MPCSFIRFCAKFFKFKIISLQVRLQPGDGKFRFFFPSVYYKTKGIRPLVRRLLNNFSCVNIFFDGHMEFARLNIMLCAIVKSWLISWLMSLLKVNRNSHLQNVIQTKNLSESVRTLMPFFTDQTLLYYGPENISCQETWPTCFDNEHHRNAQRGNLSQFTTNLNTTPTASSTPRIWFYITRLDFLYLSNAEKENRILW